MSAIERIEAALSGPGGRMSRFDWNIRVQTLSVNYPSLAAAIAELLLEHNKPVPGPLRHARNNVNQEKLSGIMHEGREGEKQE